MKRLGQRDRAVVEAFLDRCPEHGGYKLDTDGAVLDGLWFGGRNLARWTPRGIDFPQVGGRSGQLVQRYVRRCAPRQALLSNVKHRRTAALPHGGCEAAGRCVEPVPAEERCR